MSIDKNSYSLVNENVRCLGTKPTHKGFYCGGNLCSRRSSLAFVANDECREVCDSNDACKFYAIWNTNWCETYSECPSEAHDGHYKIRLWKQNDVLG